MGDVAFFLLLILVTIISFSVSEALQIRRRRKRMTLLASRTPESDENFTIGISAIEPVPQGFVRAFRLAVGRALGVDAQQLRPSDRIAGDLKAINFDAWELASVLERVFDVRVRVVDVARAGTLRDLCKILYTRGEEASEHNPPLHRDPVPKERAPEPEVVEPITVTVKDTTTEESATGQDDDEQRPA
jgi:hypothetical protein